jgi:transcription elongation factor Elf1/putative flippase GtrA
MSVRKILLRLMLLALAFSAIAGVMAMLLGSGEVVGRVVGTGIEAAVAAGALLLLTLMIDRERPRAAGLAGMCGVTFAFILSMAITWDFRFASRGDEYLPLTLLLTLGATPPVMLALYVTRLERGRYAGLAGLIVCSICVGMLLIAIWGDAFFTRSWEGSEQWSASGFTVLGLGLLAAISMAGVEVQRRWWHFVGVICAVFACIWCLTGIWQQTEIKSQPVLVGLIGLAGVIAHANLTSLCMLSGHQRWLRVASVGAVALTALLLEIMAIAKDLYDGDSLVARSAGASALAAACGTLAVVIVSRLNRKVARRTVPENVKQLTITCPWCGKKESLPLGSSACGGCGLKFEIRVEEPRCTNCDYLLYMMTSDKCPECGTPIDRRGTNGDASETPVVAPGPT